MRFIRLALGVFILIQAVMAGDWAMGLLGAAFTSMPVFNIGCCGAGGCNTTPTNKTSETTKNISYEEVV